MKRILLLSDINSAHTQKWAVALQYAGYPTGIFSLSQPQEDWYSVHGIQLLSNSGFEKKQFYSSDILKLKYLLNRSHVHKAIQQFKPDLVHAHYLTSYGSLGRMSGFHPLIVSAWGSDLLDFPQRSYFHRKLIRMNLHAADKRIASSVILADEIRKTFKMDCEVIPFGIDVNRFVPSSGDQSNANEEIVIGTIKSLEPVYCLDVLIRAFAKVKKQNPEKKLKLMLVGDGSLETHLRNLVKELNLTDETQFAGKVKYDEVHRYHQQIDIFVNISERESFGVSVLEASASGKPVIVSKAQGLKEVFRNELTGIAVEIKNTDDTANAIDRLVKDPSLRLKMGLSGREFVTKEFSWGASLHKLLGVYESVLK
ncbi:MAG TPA: glycosyltransferase family 4 protein [Bacteroidia bacterium]|nr:glycosyltransferase family 4 protein [Bacteroidia bacterium]HNP99586.1 glycosyltransferase family 4 protein [Bacteroidia bacterium]